MQQTITPSSSALQPSERGPGNLIVNALSKVVFLGTALLGAALVATAPAQAQSLKGGYELSGDTRVGRPKAAAPAMAPIKFWGDIDVSTTGSFSGATPSMNPEIAKIKIMKDDSGAYSASAISDFIKFGTVSLGGKTGMLTFDLDETPFERTKTSDSLELASAFTGSFKLDGEFFSTGTGFFSASQVEGTSFDYDLTVGEPVPEPLTILGTLAAVGLLGVGKRELDKSGAEKSDDVV
ncbi:hypothetical protein S7335_3908 [Synechococcus sp. PCC 7335]|uniref:PEP-CTERM sorting domain-containing protein n=1 Tax=Synechococcus sp. (strain ATCC 29403 / PCC 7335) TaxID=91464 RepID=UPI00017EBB94|nr:PEP-CTERM sorting domain-containing protein [Synechococcus sp. PCC 7335]EDX86205.1 hypothetical protein S7335_3908 [Synechococcus sp. PCC 7335]